MKFLFDIRLLSRKLSGCRFSRQRRDNRGANLIPAVRDFLFMGYFLCILKSKVIDKYYIGSSQNPRLRLSYHNSIEKGFTSRYRPWEIVYEKEFDSKVSAQAAEQKIKKWKSKVMIERIISDLTNI
jgi:putative endonuclease